MICVPAANISGVQPERRNVVAERSSHLCALFVPSAAVTSKCTQEWGLTKSIFVTTPEIVMSSSIAKLPKPWCASAGAAMRLATARPSRPPAAV